MMSRRHTGPDVNSCRRCEKARLLLIRRASHTRTERARDTHSAHGRGTARARTFARYVRPGCDASRRRARADCAPLKRKREASNRRRISISCGKISDGRIRRLVIRRIRGVRDRAFIFAFGAEVCIGEPCGFHG